MKNFNLNLKTVRIIILLASLLVYLPSLSNQFLWDDEEQIVANTRVHSLANIPNLFTSGVINYGDSKLSAGFYRPLVTTTYTLLYSLGSGKPITFRLFQILIHSLNSLLVFYIFLYLFNKFSDEANITKFALIGSLIYAVHPGISEAVLFNSGLGEPLFTLFLLCALLQSLKYLSTKKTRHLVFTGIFFFAGLLTKETALIFLPILVLYLLLFKFFQKGKSLLIWAGSSFLLYLALRSFAVGISLEAKLDFPSIIGQASLPERLLTIPYEISFYLLLSLAPFKLAIQQHSLVTSVTDFRFWGNILFLAVLLLSLLFLKIKAKKYYLFFWGWFLLGIFPVTNLVPLASTVAERWFYLPFIGLLGILITFIIQLKKLYRYYSLIILSVSTGLFSVLTIIRSTQWKDGFTLYSHDIQINPDSFDLANNYGVELLRKGNTPQAEKYFRKSIELNPRWWTSYNNLGVIEQQKGNLSEAKYLFQQSIDNGKYYLAYQNLALQYVLENSCSKEEEFITQAVLKFPTNYKLRTYYTICLYENGQNQEALKQASILLQLAPSAQSKSLFEAISKGEPINKDL